MKKKQQDHSKTIYDLQAEICSALANPVRLQILDLLSDQEMTATDLLEVLKIPKANLSQHLSVLKDAGILNSRKDGLYQYLTVAIPTIKEACSLVKNVLAEKMAREEKKNAELIRELKSKRSL